MDKLSGAQRAPAARTASKRWRFEYPDRDFPFYDGEPMALAIGQWLALLLAVATGFAVLIALPIGIGFVPDFVRAMLFSAIPATAGFDAAPTVFIKA